MSKPLTVGDKASVSKVFTEEDVHQFAGISGDCNPIHLDREFAETSVFGRRIVHGMLIAGLFSGLLGTKLPGRGAIYMHQRLDFKVPVAIGERVTAFVEIVHIRTDKPIVTLRTYCLNDQSQIVVDGEAVVKAN